MMIKWPKSFRETTQLTVNNNEVAHLVRMFTQQNPGLQKLEEVVGRDVILLVETRKPVREIFLHGVQVLVICRETPERLRLQHEQSPALALARLGGAAAARASSVACADVVPGVLGNKGDVTLYSPGAIRALNKAGDHVTVLTVVLMMRPYVISWTVGSHCRIYKTPCSLF